MSLTLSEVEAKSARNRKAWAGNFEVAKVSATGNVGKLHDRSPDHRVKTTAKAKTSIARVASGIEAQFALQLSLNLIPAPIVNYRHIDGRKFECDFAWPALKLGVEVQGHAHRIREKFEADIEKRALAQLDGWTILEVSGKTIRDGRAIEWFNRIYQQVNQARRGK